MCLVKRYPLWLFCLLTMETLALNCRSDGGPKEAELKSIYNKCLKMKENNSSQRRSHDDHDWKEPLYNQRDWERGRMGDDSRDERGRKNSNDGTRSEGKKYGRDDRNGGRDTRVGNRDRMSGTNDGMDRDGMSGRNNMMGSNDNPFGRNNHVNGREDFPHSNEFGSDTSQYNNHHSTTQASRRYKRDRRTENSGQRSQYNPNPKKSGHEEFQEENFGDNNSSKETDHKACALHCFMENLEMIGDNGMPDRYLVTHAITKDVKNEDLKDFLQESIEECFQILDNEKSDDKCEFSKNLLVCLSEKGRSNCDDWKDDLRF